MEKIFHSGCFLFPLREFKQILYIDMRNGADYFLFPLREFSGFIQASYSRPALCAFYSHCGNSPSCLFLLTTLPTSSTFYSHCGNSDYAMRTLIEFIDKHLSIPIAGILLPVLRGVRAGPEPSFYSHCGNSSLAVSKAPLMPIALSIPIAGIRPRRYGR